MRFKLMWKHSTMMRKKPLPMNLRLAMGFVGCILCTMVRRAHPTVGFIGLNSDEKIGGSGLSRRERGWGEGKAAASHCVLFPPSGFSFKDDCFV